MTTFQWWNQSWLPLSLSSSQTANRGKPRELFIRGAFERCGGKAYTRFFKSTDLYKVNHRKSFNVWKR